MINQDLIINICELDTDFVSWEKNCLNHIVEATRFYKYNIMVLPVFTSDMVLTWFKSRDGHWLCILQPFLVLSFNLMAEAYVCDVLNK